MVLFSNVDNPVLVTNLYVLSGTDKRQWRTLGISMKYL